MVKKVDFMCVGAAKCGTSALNLYLAQHPKISTARGKSTRYFTKRLHKGRGWYHEHFDPTKPVWGECTFGYGISEPALQAIKAYQPTIPLWLLVRDPADRTFSHLWWDCEKMGTLPRRMVQRALDGGSLPTRISRQSGFAGTVSRIVRYVPKCTLRIIPTGVLYRSPVATLNTLFATLGLEPHDVEPLISNERNYPQPTEKQRRAMITRWGSWRERLQAAIANGLAGGTKIEVLTEDQEWADNINSWSLKATVSK